MEVELRLKDGHCIETVADEKYEELARELIRGEDEVKGEKLDFLKDFLESADFSELRAAGFDGSEEMLVRVCREGSGFSVEEIG